MLNDSPIAAKEKESEIKSISNSWGVYEQWSRYKENEVDKHRSFEKDLIFFITSTIATNMVSTISDLSKNCRFDHTIFKKS